ncbi:tumor necrosis factor receptor superfamily, member a isoform X2 [Dunckerocampus dactyliophorus]|uniref:tumor necrosis factor receptor superfamily, member a isoform X2 n=1 Tax=Dunckerocampus dactyliophorus TaxID=161453 RepID=UPI0024069D14|nr:tumor necrosis factor receptor superfamily, member a isoform X2 [Dunckerocampus dactyliophorus]
MNTGPALGKLSVLLAVLVLVVRSPCRAAEPPAVAAAAAAAQWSGDDFRNLTLRRHRTCVENEQYHHQGLCCLNCQAGTFVLRACERDHHQGACSPCEHGHTYTEHSNGMNRCLPCTHCRQDEMETASCTTTSDTRCQCKPGTFCVPDQACEVCKRCAKCKSGEEEVEKCTYFSNTVCRKRHPSPTQTPSPQTPPTPASPAEIAVPILCCLLVVVAVGLAVWWFVIKQRSFQPCVKSHFEACEIVKVPIDESAPTAEECQNSRNAGLEGEDSRPESRPLLQETQAGMTKASSPVEDEDRGLGDSLPNTTSSSQTSLSALPTAASSGNSPQQSPAACRVTPAAMEDPLQHRLVPLQESEKSLRKSFDLFDKYLDVGIHNKFFRNIGVSDNHIRMAEGGVAGDKVYELLKNWMQRQGLKADINQLLQALLDLDQRRSAESIASEALRRGFYKHAP